ncbi:MAG: hypothetical protein ABIV43_00045 [Candidatus Saccharimonadales bacterium]
MATHKPRISTKRTAISKANAQMVLVVSIASFVTVFSLVATKTVLSQNSYQNKVIKAKDTAHQQLLRNISAADSLIDSYNKFVAPAANIIGGQTSGVGDRDGDNGKIVLDALPSSYDFPALASSLEKILSSQSLKVSSIAGIDDQVNQETNLSSPTPEAVPMPFSFSVANANYDAIQSLIKTLESSIRPIQVDTLTISGGGSNMQASITAHTYYQPAKNLQITSEVVPK